MKLLWVLLGSEEVRVCRHLEYLLYQEGRVQRWLLGSSLLQRQFSHQQSSERRVTGKVNEKQRSRKPSGDSVPTSATGTFHLFPLPQQHTVVCWSPRPPGPQPSYRPISEYLCLCIRNKNEGQREAKGGRRKRKPQRKNGESRGGEATRGQSMVLRMFSQILQIQVLSNDPTFLCSLITCLW